MKVKPLGQYVIIEPKDFEDGSEEVSLLGQKQMLALGTVMESSNNGSVFKGDEVIFFHMKSHKLLPQEDLVAVDTDDIVAIISKE